MSVAVSQLHEPGQGTAYRYQIGCRCDECTEAARVARTRARARARAENRPSYQHELEIARRLKNEVYAGTCDHCGAKTTGCNGPGTAPTVCADCAPTVYGPRYRAEKLGKGPVVEKLLAFLSEPHTYAEIKRHLDISAGHAGVLLTRHVKTGLIVRLSRGVYQRADTNGAA